uniref:VP9 n=1 Tax=Aedes pseudoscutellaris reovirus TaxID=341721 RepID=A0A679DYM0_APRV|nr:VP9 [Aedes pseudoscutellaris reovirus]
MNSQKVQALTTVSKLSPLDKVVKGRNIPFSMPGDRVIMLKISSLFKFNREDKESDSKFDLVPTDCGICMVKTQLNQNEQKRTTFNDGKVIEIITYEQMKDILPMIKQVVHEFYSWRRGLMDTSTLEARNEWKRVSQLDFRRCNSSLIFYISILILSEYIIEIPIEYLTVFYGGYNFNNIRTGEWFNTDDFNNYQKIIKSGDVCDLFLINDIGEYKYINAITHVTKTNMIFSFNMQVPRPPQFNTTMKVRQTLSENKKQKSSSTSPETDSDMSEFFGDN